MNKSLWNFSFSSSFQYPFLFLTISFFLILSTPSKFRFFSVVLPMNSLFSPLTLYLYLLYQLNFNKLKSGKKNRGEIRKNGKSMDNKAAEEADGGISVAQRGVPKARPTLYPRSALIYFFNSTFLA